MSTAPRVFVSYSYDSRAHEEWVLKLCQDLRGLGIDVVFDKWHVALGQDLAAFMTDGISRSDRVILICSAPYVAKSDSGTGGVGFERLIVTSELVTTIDTKKFIPVLRDNTGAVLPRFLGPRRYADFRSDGGYAERLTELARELHNQPSVLMPPLGPNPFGATVGPTEPPEPIAATSAIPRSVSDGWFEEKRDRGLQGLAALSLTGSMELRFALAKTIKARPQQLLEAVRNSEINTFGWPIGIVLNTPEYRPSPIRDGILTEVSIADGLMSGKPSYDLWAARQNGDFYLIHSLFEDARTENSIFFDTRIVRVTESLMFCARFYRNLGVASDQSVTLRVRHEGLRGRVLVSASPDRHLFPRVTKEVESESELNMSLAALGGDLVANVRDILDPMFALFDFTQISEAVYREIVERFAEGRSR